MKPTVKILLVTDDFYMGQSGNGGYLRWSQQVYSDAISNKSREFHLGEFTRTLEETNWVGFKIELTKAHRTTVEESKLSEAALKADRGADVVGFRFDQTFTFKGETRKLADYDMALFFSIKPEDPQTNDSLLLAEAESVAEFMEKGGGFFATGDHANLGAYLCGLIPRVRSMRRWWIEPPVDMLEAPSASGADRHDTTQAGSDNITNFEDQSDEIPQPISPKMYDANGPTSFIPTQYPHPVLCTPLGVMDVLPDHMHEGACDVPNHLASRTYILNGMVRREYPDYTPRDGSASPLAPEVIAEVVIPKGRTSEVLDSVHTGGTIPTTGGTYGVIGVWDGHLVNQGRVVVDATWHHFFNINLSGDRYLEDVVYNPGMTKHLQKLFGFFVLDNNGNRVPNSEFKKIQCYYRNIIYWLIPANRRSGIWFHTMEEFARRPEILEVLGTSTLENVTKRFTIRDYLYFGKLAESYFAKTRGLCAILTSPHFPVPEYLPKIPWWEWVQEAARIWEVQAEKNQLTDRVQAAKLASMSLGMDPRVLNTIGMGTALVAASICMRTFRQNVEMHKTSLKMESLFLDKLWPELMQHSSVLLGEHLEQSLSIQTRLLKKMLKKTNSLPDKNHLT